MSEKEKKDGSKTKNKPQDISHEIVKNFSDTMIKKDKNYFAREKAKIIKDFSDYVNQEHGKDILKELLDGKFSQTIDVLFNQVSHTGFVIKDFLNSEKKNTVIDQLKSNNNSEKQAMQESVLQCYQKRKLLPVATQTALPFIDFIRTGLGATEITDGSGNITGINIPNTARAKTIGQVKDTWENTVRAVSNTLIDDSLKNKIIGYLPENLFDPTEKVACIATVRQLKKTIDALSGSCRHDVQSIFDSIFVDATRNPVPGTIDWTRIDQLDRFLGQFFHQVESLGNVTVEELDKLKNLKITAKDCINHGKESGDLDTNQVSAAQNNGAFSKLSQSIQKLTTRMTQIDLIHNVDTTLEQIEGNLENFAKTIDMPGNMYDFFKQFPTPDEVAPGIQSQEYKVINQQIESIKDTLSLDTNTKQEIIDLKLELQELETRKKELQKTVQLESREKYFEYIQQQVTEACKELGKNNYAEKLGTILAMLEQLNRDISKLPLHDQNIILQASIDMQLLKIKKSDVVASSGLQFESYSKFLSSLYDLNNPKSSITLYGPDKQPIELQFSQKRLVGKPSEHLDVDITNLKNLENIRVEFEIDLNKSVPKENARELIKTFTGGGKSRVIRNFFGIQNKKYPSSISDSTKVRMTGKDGKVYEGYLSPIDYSDDSIHTPDSKQEKVPTALSSTFILYDKPADQFHNDRIIRTKGDISNVAGEKAQAVYINDANLDDWTSFEVIEDKVTMSGKSINALSLAHLMGQNNNQEVNAMLSQLSRGSIESLQKDNRDYQKKDTYQDNNPEIIKNNRDKARQDTFGSKAKDSCKVGQSFAAKMKESNQAGMVRLNVTAASPNGCSIKVENLNYNGSIAGRTFVVDAKNISNLREALATDTLVELPDNKKSYQDIKSSLQSALGENKKYSFDSLEGLDFDGNNFYKGKADNSSKQKVVNFIKTTKNMGDRTNTRVDYSISGTSDGKYTISSTGYIDTRNKQGEPDQPHERIKENIDYYHNTVDLAGLILFLAEKKLAPYTAQEKSLIESDNNAPQVIPEKKNRMRSLGTIRSVVSGGGKKIIDGFKKKRGEEKDHELDYALFTEHHIYRKLDGMFGGLLERFDLNVFDDLADEVESKAMEYGREKVKVQYEQIKKFHHSYNYGVPLSGDEDGRNGANNMCAENIEKALGEYPSISYKLRCKVAGSLLYMVEKYKNGYARLLSHHPKGTYIKILFGEASYQEFLKNYKEKEHELENSKKGNQIQEQLAMMEYNFIVSNMRGGSLQSHISRDLGGSGNTKENPNAYYFQRMYGRNFASELGKMVSGIKNISRQKDNETTKGLIEGGSYEHTKNDLKDHIGQMRIEEAVAELVALQQLATTSEQQDEVAMFIMAGFMNGVFVNNLGRDTREGLKVVCRNSGIPFPARAEHHNVGRKMQVMLELASANLGKDSFENFRYETNNKKSYKSYNYIDFKGTIREKGDLRGYLDSFMKWIQKPNVKNQVFDFLYMNNLTQDDDNNLIRIRKSKPDEKVMIFGKEVNAEAKGYVSDMLGELYFNTDRGADLNNYNYAPGFNRPRTMIENAFSRMNLPNGAKWKDDVGDHAYTLRKGFDTNAPKDKELRADQKYKLAAHVDEFFRIFNGIGSVQYSSNIISSFYKYICLAKQYPKGSHERNRLLRFYPTSLVYNNGEVPPDVVPVFKKYMQCFEKNIDLFDAELGEMHLVPGSGGGENNFKDAFDNNLNQWYYRPQSERAELETGTRNKRKNDAMQHEQTIVNSLMDEANLRATGSKGGGQLKQNNILGYSIDKQWQKLRDGTGTNVGLQDEIISNKIQGLVDVINQGNIDIDSIPLKQGTPQLVAKPGKLTKEEEAAYLGAQNRDLDL